MILDAIEASSSSFTWASVVEMAVASVVASTIVSLVGIPTLKKILAKSKEDSSRRERDWALLDGYKTPDGTVMPALGVRMSQAERDITTVKQMTEHQTTLLENISKKMNGAGPQPTFSSLAQELKTMSINQENFHESISNQLDRQDRRITEVSTQVSDLKNREFNA